MSDDVFDALLGFYGTTDLWIYVPDELTMEQAKVLDDIIDNGHHDEAGDHLCFRLLHDDILERVLTELRSWGKRHEIERWSRWPTTWRGGDPDLIGADSARHTPLNRHFTDMNVLLRSLQAVMMERGDGFTAGEARAFGRASAALIRLGADASIIFGDE